MEFMFNLVPPRGDTCKHLELLSAAADSISDGDLVDRKVRSAQAWNLLPIQVRGVA